MRYADRITFVAQGPDDIYNPYTGNYEEGVSTTETRPCNLSRLGTDRTNQLFGSLDKRVIVARLQRPYTEAFDHAIVDGRTYQLTRHVPHPSESIFYLEELA